MQLKPIDQQIAAVLGASSGSERETALNVASQGAKVMACSSSKSEPKSEYASDYLFEPIAEFEQVEVDFVKPSGVYGYCNWLAWSAIAIGIISLTVATAVGALGLIVLLAR